MNNVNQFEKISLNQFKKDMEEYGLTEDIIEDIYKNIKLPTRATKGSAGYDFYSTLNCSLDSKDNIKIPTGIRAKIKDGVVLAVFPRSGMGFKYRLQLDNTVGIIDSDYYYSDNEGHIFIKVTNDTNDINKRCIINEGSAFAQGIFLPFDITVDDNATGIRNGGMGSTDAK